MVSLVPRRIVSSLAKFCNCCSMVWARMQSRWNGKNYCLSFQEEVEKSYSLFYNVFSDMNFYLHILQQSQLSKTIPVPVYLVAPVICHCCYRAQIFEVWDPRLYHSKDKFFPLLSPSGIYKHSKPVLTNYLLCQVFVK